ncbi:MAG: CDP-diacylglycerol--glycerol-3-phosphate 3-phosphatidyltransferase [Clostridia bacterium]|nr:CDP-diacylglycerol--glycerol-3-phosphate 3-phosphatidyltransferase [Clostridia bacterium]
MNIPNILTGIRFLLIPVFGYYLYNESYLLAVILFLLAGLTDVLDGYIARKFDLITTFGKLADPVADKLILITALVLLTVQSRMPIIITIVVVAKEIFMGAGSILLYRQGNHVVAANWYGKMATVIFYVAVVTTMAFKLEEPYTNILMGIAVFSTLFAFFMYSLTFRKIRNLN